MTRALEQYRWTFDGLLTRRRKQQRFIVNRLVRRTLVAVLIAFLVFAGGPCGSTDCCTERHGHSNGFSETGQAGDSHLHTHGSFLCLVQSTTDDCRCCCSEAHLPPVLRGSPRDDGISLGWSASSTLCNHSSAGIPCLEGAKVPLITSQASDPTLRSISSTVLVI